MIFLGLVEFFTPIKSIEIRLTPIFFGLMVDFYTNFLINTFFLIIEAMDNNVNFMADECYSIVGAAMEVHKALGKGFTEYVYQDALEVEFKQRGIPYEREKPVKVYYKGVELQHSYIADFVCYGEIIVELKAISTICSVHSAQVINYLHATEKKLGLLLNFGADSLQKERLVNFNIIPRTALRLINALNNKK